MGEEQIATKQQHLLYYMVKGSLIPASFSQKDILTIEESYTKRLWGNNERQVYTIEAFETLYGELND
jgi:hypothetical protein|tara:strand:+ start:1275 stop:1475 length:201 start_codon:yes stop_codon:yes gene_type:complete